MPRPNHLQCPLTTDHRPLTTDFLLFICCPWSRCLWSCSLENAPCVFLESPHISLLPIPSDNKRNVFLLVSHYRKCIKQQFESFLPINSRQKQNNSASS